MNTVRAGLLIVIFALSGFSQASSTQVHRQARVSDRERLLVHGSLSRWQLLDRMEKQCPSVIRRAC